MSEQRIVYLLQDDRMQWYLFEYLVYLAFSVTQVPCKAVLYLDTCN